MSLSLNPSGKNKVKADLIAAKNEISKTNEYRFNIVIDRDTMIKFQTICKKRRVSTQTEIKRFIDREINRFNELIP